MPGMRCAMYGCNKNYFDIKKNNEKCIFHRFPKGKDLESKTIRNEWIARCKRDDNFNADTGYVCSVHFTENDYERDLQNELLGLPLRKILKKTAVPTLLLFNKKPLSNPISKSKRLHSKHARQKAQQVVPELLATASISTIASNTQSEILEISQKNSPPEPKPECSSKPQKINYKAKYMNLLDNFNNLRKKYSLLKASSIKTEARCIKMIKQNKILNYQLRCFKTKYYNSLKCKVPKTAPKVLLKTTYSESN